MLRQILSEVVKEQDKNKVITKITGYVTPVERVYDKLLMDTELQAFCYQHELGSEIKKAMTKMSEACDALKILLKEAEKEVAMLNKKHERS